MKGLIGTLWIVEDLYRAEDIPSLRQINGERPGTKDKLNRFFG
jgi:hypothetical protein